jgi:hypothetical protein
MRTAVLAGVLILAAPLSLTGQLRREPLIAATPFGVLNPPRSPIELAAGIVTVGEGSLSSGQLPAPRQHIRLRSRDPMLAVGGVIVRVAAGLFDDGMVTYRLQMTDELRSDTMAPSPFAPGWHVRVFLRVAGEPPPDVSRVGRQTRFLMTVEQVTDVAGKVVFDNADAREQLWRALGGDKQ